MAESELKIKLRGEDAGLTGMLNRVGEKLDGVAAKGTPITGLQNAFGGLQSMLVAGGVIAAVTALAEGVKKLISAAAEAEAVQVKLAATLRATGQYSEEAVEGINAWGAEMLRTKGISDDLAASLVAQGATMGLSVEASKELVEVAGDIAVVTGDLPGAFEALAKASDNDAAAMMRLGKQFNLVPKEGEVFEQYLIRLREKVDGLAEANMQSFTAQWVTFKENIGNFLESAGTPLLRWINDIVKATNAGIAPAPQSLEVSLNAAEQTLIAARARMQKELQEYNKDTGKVFTRARDIALEELNDATNKFAEAQKAVEKLRAELYKQLNPEPGKTPEEIAQRSGKFFASTGAGSLKSGEKSEDFKAFEQSLKERTGEAKRLEDAQAQAWDEAYGAFRYHISNGVKFYETTGAAFEQARLETLELIRRFNTEEGANIPIRELRARQGMARAEQLDLEPYDRALEESAESYRKYMAGIAAEMRAGFSEEDVKQALQQGTIQSIEESRQKQHDFIVEKYKLEWQAESDSDRKQRALDERRHAARLRQLQDEMALGQQLAGAIMQIGQGNIGQGISMLGNLPNQDPRYAAAYQIVGGSITAYQQGQKGAAVGSLVGAGIGAFVGGGPTGAMVGGAIGGTIGGLFDSKPPKTEGGKIRQSMDKTLDDLFGDVLSSWGGKIKGSGTIETAVRPLYEAWVEAMTGSTKGGRGSAEMLAKIMDELGQAYGLANGQGADYNLTLGQQADVMGNIIAATKKVTQFEGDMIAVREAMLSVSILETQQMDDMIAVYAEAAISQRRYNDLQKQITKDLEAAADAFEQFGADSAEYATAKKTLQKDRDEWVAIKAKEEAARKEWTDDLKQQGKTQEEIDRLTLGVDERQLKTLEEIRDKLGNNMNFHGGYIPHPGASGERIARVLNSEFILKPEQLRAAMEYGQQAGGASSAPYSTTLVVTLDGREVARSTHKHTRDLQRSREIR